MKKLVIGIVLIFVLVFMAACAPSASTLKPAIGERPVSSGQTGQQAAEKEGRVVFTITDAAADMGAVTKVMLTVDDVQVHSETEGWVTVSSTPTTVDLLKLKAEGSQELLADAKLKEGDYQHLRLDISKIVVVDAAGEHEAKLPSGELKFVGGFTVTENSISTAKFDFVADESLHTTGKGEYILAPVVQLETRENADVVIKADEKVEVKNGNVKTNTKVGMDIDGKVGVGVSIAKNAKLSLKSGKVALETAASLGLTTEKKTSSEDNASASLGVKVKVGY